MLMFILGLVIGSLGGVFAMCLCKTASRADKDVYQPTEEITTSPPNCGSSILSFKNGSELKVLTCDVANDNVRGKRSNLVRWIESDGSEWFRDIVGGLHSEGLGWHPNGSYCGECSYTDCSTCEVYNKSITQE